MNCKQGDLAILVKSEAGNEGKIVRCVAFIGDQILRSKNDERFFESNCWRIDPPMVGARGNLTSVCPDAYLLPIRQQPEDATDETMTWLHVPNKNTGVV